MKYSKGLYNLQLQNTLGRWKKILKKQKNLNLAQMLKTLFWKGAVSSLNCSQQGTIWHDRTSFPEEGDARGAFWIAHFLLFTCSRYRGSQSAYCCIQLGQATLSSKCALNLEPDAASRKFWSAKQNYKVRNTPFVYICTKMYANVTCLPLHRGLWVRIVRKAYCKIWQDLSRTSWYFWYNTIHILLIGTC